MNKKCEEANKRLGIGNTDSLRDNQIIFVYCSQKVGSTSLVSSLRIALNNNYTILHIHNEYTLSILYSIYNVSVMDIIQYNKEKGKKVIVIDIYRSIVEQRMSLFFENIETYHFNTRFEDTDTCKMKLIVKRFNQLFPHIKVDDHYREKYGILCPEQFDNNNKYLRIEKDGIVFIKLRLVDSNHWSNILSDILQEKIFIIEDYKTCDKKISKLYSFFKNEYRMPQNIYYLLEEDKGLQYYYSTEERTQYLLYWKNKTIIDSFCYFTPEQYKLYIEISNDNQHLPQTQYDHYIDNGCVCEICKKQRRLLFAKLCMGKTDIERINHNECILDKIKKKNDKIKKRRNVSFLLNK